MNPDEFEQLKAKWSHIAIWLPRFSREEKCRQSFEKNNPSRLISTRNDGREDDISSLFLEFAHLTKNQAKEIAPLLMEFAVAETKGLSFYKAIITLANEGGAAVTRQEESQKSGTTSNNTSTNKNKVNGNDNGDIEENHFALYTTKSKDRATKKGGQSLLFKAFDIWQQTITPGKMKKLKNDCISESSAVQSMKDLITIGGKSYLLNSVRMNDDEDINDDNDDDDNDETVKIRENILHHTFENAGLPMEVFKLIIDVGGKELLLQQNKKGHTALHLAFMGEMSFSYVDEYELVDKKHFPKSGILSQNERVEAIKYMIEAGGKDLLLMKCDCSFTFLDYALIYSSETLAISQEMIKMMIDIGGDELVFSEDLVPNLGRRSTSSLDIVKILVERQGTNLLYATNSFWHEGFRHEVTILHMACAHRRSKDFIKYLIDVGQEKLVLMKSQKGRSTLDYALGGMNFHFSSSTSLDVVDMLCEVGGHKLDFDRKSFHMLGISTTLDIIKYIVNKYGRGKAMLISTGKSCSDRTKNKWSMKNNILHHVCGYRERPKEIIKFMIEVAGADIVKARNSDKQSAITNLLINESCPTVEELQLLLDAVDNKDMMNTLAGFPKLLGRNLKSFDLVKYLIGHFGKPLVLVNKNGNALFHAWDTNHPSEEMIELLLDVGGTEAVLARGVEGLNALEKAIKKHGRNASCSIIKHMKKMIDLGGREASWNAFYSEARHFLVSALSLACSEDAIEIARHLCDVGGRGDVLCSKGIKIICMDRDKQYSFAVIRLLLEKGIQYKIDGADGIGGFFAALRQGKDTFWRKISKNLNSFKRLIKGQPFLQGIIPLLLDDPDTPRDLTTKYVSKQFIEWVEVKTSTGVLPIEIATRWDLGWKSGMKEIFEATRKRVVKKSSLCVGAQFGLRWSNKMCDIIQENVCEIDVVDEETGLYPFMLAACEFSDLSVIYDLLVLRSDVLISCVAGKKSTGCKRKADSMST